MFAQSTAIGGWGLPPALGLRLDVMFSRQHFSSDVKHRFANDSSKKNELIYTTRALTCFYF